MEELNHGLVYGFLISMKFDYIEVNPNSGLNLSSKAITYTILEECEYDEKKEDVGLTSTMSCLITA